jgi:hypothetical protein
VHGLIGPGRDTVGHVKQHVRPSGSRRDNARIRGLDPREALEQGRFAGAVRSDQSEYFAGANGQMDVLKGANGSVRFGQSSYGEKYIRSHGPGDYHKAVQPLAISNFQHPSVDSRYSFVQVRTTPAEIIYCSPDGSYSDYLQKDVGNC